MEDLDFLNTYAYLQRINENYVNIQKGLYKLENFSDFKSKNSDGDSDSDSDSDSESGINNGSGSSSGSGSGIINNKNKYYKDNIKYKAKLYWLYVIFFLLIGLILLSILLRFFIYKSPENNNYDNTNTNIIDNTNTKYKIISDDDRLNFTNSSELYDDVNYKDSNEGIVQRKPFSIIEFLKKIFFKKREIEEIKGGSKRTYLKRRNYNKINV
jgi:hypothetical protein